MTTAEIYVSLAVGAVIIFAVLIMWHIARKAKSAWPK